MKALVALVLPLALVGCDGPCRVLAERVCECTSPSPNEQNACLLRLDTNEDRDPTDAEEENCDRLLDTCSCAALQQGRLEACGVSPLPTPPPSEEPSP